MIREGEVVGVLGLASFSPRDFSADALFIETLASEASTAFGNALLYEKLQAHATELKNRLLEIERVEGEKRGLFEQLLQAQKMEAVGTLAGGIAHDFNNVLNAIIGYVELAQDHLPSGSRAVRFLEKSLTASDRARQLVGHILTFSRKEEVDLTPLALGHIVKEALQLLRASLPSTIQIKSQVERGTGLIMANPTQVHQVLMNLCTNAAHAMGEAGGILEVTVGRADLDEGGHRKAYLELCVADSGQGIPPENLSRIFEPYFTTKERGEGTGLGLAVVRGIVENHGGRITVKSLPGQGAVFQVLFPLIEQAHESEAVESTGESLGGSESILVVDDEKDVAQVYKGLLEMIGYRVVACNDSREGLDLFRADPDRFQLVITDYTMPHMTGIALAERLLALKPDLAVVLATGYGDRITPEILASTGIRGFIQKPASKQILCKAVRDALDA
jgi:signal transduction histidine kinase